MIRMYGFWRSAASFRVRIALNLKGLAYRETMIDLDAGEQHAPGYRAMNAQSVVPSLFVDDGPPLTQSLAILEYLEETYPQPALLPADARGRSRVRSLALLFAADHHPLIVPRVRRYLADELQIDEARRTGWLRHWFREGLVQAERRLSAESGTGRFCHGDTPGMADLCLISQVAGARASRSTPRSCPPCTGSPRPAWPWTPSPAPIPCASRAHRHRIRAGRVQASSGHLDRAEAVSFCLSRKRERSETLSSLDREVTE